jgi:phage repressor protein C with HTH and peptisase S24 domain
MENQGVTIALKRIREGAGVGLREMARRLGLSPSSYGHYEDPERFKAPFLPFEQARSFSEALSDHPEAAAAVLQLAGIAPKTGFREEPRLEFALPAMIDVYDVHASAGHGTTVDTEYVVERLSFPPQFLARLTKTPPKHLAIIGVKGESMLPTIADDDLVMLDTTKKNLDFDGLFVLKFGDALHVKRISRSGRDTVMIISDNSNYPAQSWARDEIEVVGKVIWMGKKL